MRSPIWLKLFDDSWGAKLPHDVASPGDIITLEAKDGSKTEVRLLERVTGEQHWSIWRVTRELTPPAPPVKRVQARKPVIRRGGVVHRLPVMTPEPPPLTDADAPPPPNDD